MSADNSPAKRPEDDPRRTPPDWTPEFEGQRPPFGPGNEVGKRFEPGNAAAVRHGVYSKLKLTPRAAEIAETLRNAVWIGDADAAAIETVSVVLAQVEAAAAWIDEHGMADNEGKPQGILRHLGTMVNTAGRQLDRLGLTPSGRADMGLAIAAAENMVQFAELQTAMRALGEIAMRHIAPERHEQYLDELEEVLGRSEFRSGGDG